MSDTVVAKFELSGMVPDLKGALIVRDGKPVLRLDAPGSGIASIETSDQATCDGVRAAFLALIDSLSTEEHPEVWSVVDS